MKKNCNDCRALLGNSCTLGYKTKVEYKKVYLTYEIPICKPLQECEKPKTYSDYFTLLNAKK